MSFSVKIVFLISLSLVAQMNAHLSLFPDNFDIDSTASDIEDKLHLFPSVSFIIFLI